MVCKLTMYFEDQHEFLIHQYRDGKIPRVFHGFHTGFLLLEILNLSDDDLSTIEQTVSGLNSNNAKSIFDGTLSTMWAMRCYAPEEIEELQHDFFSIDGPSATRLSTATIKDTIACFEDHPDWFKYEFLRYLSDRYFLLSNVETAQEENLISPVYNPERDSMANMSTAEKLAAMHENYESNHTEIKQRYIYKNITTPRFSQIAAISLMELARAGKVIRKCKNCGQYFIPENRSDTLYCNNPSPADPTKTCKEYGSQRLWYERQKDDELATLSRNILSAKSMLAKRNSDLPDYKMFYDFFRKERIRWKKAVESGEKSREEYREWLLFMKHCKTFKEAGITPPNSNR